MSGGMNLKTSLLIAVFLVGIGYTIAAADVIYVNANAPGLTHDGTSWPSAYLSLQDALDRPPTSGDQIWVAPGTYKPGSSRTDSFEMVNGVTIYGGFPDSGEPNLADRDWQSNETILSGDIGAVGNNTDNCYHVVYNPEGANLDSTAVLDGFTITGGNANGGTYRWGGGLFNCSCSPTVTNCTFYGNAAATMGGGMANHDHSSPTVTNCTFYDNSATSAGGGLSNSVYSSPTVTNCTFSGNSASWAGGIWNEVYSSPIVTNCILWANSPDSIDNYSFNSSPLVTYCDVQAGTGQIWFGEGCIDEDPCLFDATGGDLHLLPDSPCIDAGTNSAPNLPPTDFEGDTRIIDGIVDIGADEFNIFYELTTSTEPEEGGTITLTPPGGYYFEERQVTVTANPAAGHGFDHWSGDLAGSTNPNSVVMDANKTVTAHFGYTLTVNTAPVMGGSVTLEPAGGIYQPDTEVTLTAQPALGFALDHWSGDLTGNTNPTTIVMDSAKSVSAHFIFGADIIYVDGDATGNSNGTSWMNALTDLQDALVRATPGQQIWVAEGVYKPGASQTDSFQMKNGVAIYGGFPDSGDPGWVDRDPNIYLTILSGDLKDDDIPGFGNVQTLFDNCIHVFYHPSGLGLDGTAILDGVTISGGFGMGTGESANGAGMYNNTASPAVTGCRFSNNFALGDTTSVFGQGGGMYNVDSAPSVTYCEFSTNFSYGHGAGMYNLNSAPTVINCNFVGNSTYYSGGGMYNNNSDPCVIDCHFTANIVYDMGAGGDGGGGMANIGSNPTVTDCTFVDNQAVNPEQFKVPVGGGMLIANSSSPTVTDCVFTGNSSEGGGGMAIGTGCSPTITDCTFTANEVQSDFFSFPAVPANGGGAANAGTSIITGCEFNSNTAEDDGGGLYCSDLGVTLNQCTFLNNSSGNNGGGIYLGESTTITSSIFAGNSASNDGGGIYLRSGIEAIVTNCTFYQNTAGEGGGIFSDYDARLTITNSILWADSPDEIDRVPSPAGVVTVSYCDIQSKDYVGSSGNFMADPLFVDVLINNFHLQSESPCINAGNNTAPGLPTEDIDGNYRIMDGRVEIGADEIAPIYVKAGAQGRNDGSKWADAFTDFQDAVDSAPGGVDIWVAVGTYRPGNERTDSFSLKGGEVIYGGFPDAGDPVWDDHNGPIYQTILSGDIGVEGSAADNCYHVLHNEGRAGQAVSYLDGFIITGGNADGSDEFGRGGGIYNFFFDLYLTNCLLVDNSADIGGGMCSLGSFVSLANCLLSGNTATEGGGMYNFLSFLELINCTVSGNDAGVGGGVSNGGFAEMSASNCIFWSNNGGEIYNDADSFATVRYSDVQGSYGAPNANNIDAEPLFVEPTYGDFRLRSDSPCIDRGDSNAVPAEVTSDRDGNPRILDGDCNDTQVVDMGAYEFNWHGIGDFDNDCFINFFDFSISARYWMTDESFVDIAPPGGDGIVDFQEFAIIANHWLEGTVPE